MVIDFHTHAFPDAIAKRAMDGLIAACNGIYTPCTDGTANGLVKAMDEFGVDISVVQPVVTKPSQIKTLNEWAKSIQNDRLVSFGGIHPATDDYKRDIDFVCSLGLRGLKFHPEYQNFTVDSPEMLKIYDYALSRNLILLFHAGFDPAFPPPFRSNPRGFANIVESMQGGTIVAAHFGSHAMWDDVEKYLVGKNIYLDTSMGFSYFPHDQFVRIVNAHGADKVLFATDSPWSRADEEIAALKSLALTDLQKQQILYKNALTLLSKQ